MAREARDPQRKRAIMRWYRAVGLTVVLVGLAACDQFGSQSEALTYDPLPDPAVDWRPYADQALEGQRCSAFLGLISAARGAGDRDTIQYLGILERREICDSNQDGRALGGLLIPMLIERLQHDARTPAAQIKQSRSSVPYYRRISYQSQSSSDLLLSEGLVQAERAWIERCEGPLRLFYGSEYEVRLILAQDFGDQSVLISEWESRRAECRPRLVELVALYREAAQEQTQDENRVYLLTVALAYEDALNGRLMLP